MADAFFEEVALVVYEQLGDAVEGAPATLNAVNEEFGAVALGVEVALDFGGGAIVFGG